jgi:hypothetical protein
MLRLRPCNATKQERQFLKTAAIEDARLDAVLEAKKHEVDAEAEDDGSEVEIPVRTVSEVIDAAADPAEPAELLDATETAAALKAGDELPLAAVAMEEPDKILLTDEMIDQMETIQVNVTGAM